MGKLIAVVSLVLLLVPGVASANLLTNGDFESGSVTPWTTIGFHTGAANSTAAFAGSYGLDMTLVQKSGSDGWGGKYQNKAAAAGNIYSFSSQINTSTLNSEANAGLQIAFFDVLNPGFAVSPTATFDTTLNNGNGWTTVSVLSAPAPVGTQAVRFVLVGFAAQSTDFPGTGHAYFDNADAVQVVPEPMSLLLLGSGLIGLVGFSRKK